MSEATIAPAADRWHGVHVFCAAADRLLVECVAPLVRSLREDGLVERFFFLRYWEEGFHVRLRFLLPDPPRARATIRARLEAFLQRQPPSPPGDQDAHRAWQERLGALEGTAPAPLAPANSLAVRPYQPELDKYGGPAGMEIAERLFDRSSTIALQLLPALAAEERRLGVALAMMVIGLRAFGVPRRLSAGFFRRYQGIWARYLEAFAPALAPAAAERGRRAAPALRPRVLSLLDGEAELTGPLLSWREAMVSAARDLDRVVLPQVDGVETRKAQLLCQYLHVHNNRLGLQPTDESYLCELGSAALEAAA